jgi:hypothetical protein
MISTNQEDFRPFKVTKKKGKTLFWSASPARTSQLTSYKNAFCEWEIPKVNHEKRFHPPVRSTEIPFTSSTLYQTCYNQSSTSDNPGGLWLNDLKTTSKSTEFTFGPPNEKLSTYQSEMKDFSKNQLNPKETRTTPNKAIFSETKSKYQATSKIDFSHQKSRYKDPRELKVALEAASLNLRL